MASDDRDRTFDKALARHLRRSASSSPDAHAEFCPDPEILAAYHDGSLAPEERNLWKQHVMSCDNCQLVLAHLATPLDIPINLEAEENVLVAQQQVSSARTASSVPIARPSPPHSLRWLWLVPAGAIAATLIAWVSLQERKPVQFAPSSPVEVAENRQSAAVAPPPPPAIPRERKEKDQAAAPSAAAADSAIRDLASKQPQNEVQLTQPSPFQAAKPTHGPYLSAQKQEQQIARIAAGSAGAFDQKKLDAQATPNAIGGRIAGAPAQQIPVPALPPPPAPLPSSEPSFLDDGSLSANLKDKSPSATASTSSLAAPKTKAVNADAISAASESVEVSAASRAPERATLRAAALQNPHVFWAPGGKQAWRVGPAGSLEHSKDKGLNWIPQISGVYTDLLAGFAASAKICWIVGASGTILRTTDGGTHWSKLDSPVTNDLTGIRAADATHAWIWFVPDLQTGLIKTFQTTDGGATWSPAPNQ